MAITTYSELKTAIANFLARDDLTSVIPDFIQLAEATMSRELETRSQEKRATATLTADDEYIALPTDLREVREVKLNTTPITVLTYYSPVALDQKFSSGGTGKPEGPQHCRGRDEAAPGAGQQLHRRDHLHRLNHGAVRQQRHE